MRVLDLIGERFGALVVIERAGADRQQRAMWLCICDCGQQRIVASRHLRSGGTKSCGCQRGMKSAEIGRRTAHKISGPLSYLYKPDLSDEDRLSGRNTIDNREWRRSVFDRADYTCDLCGEVGKRLVAHHLHNWADHPSLRYELGNGITLCELDHKRFHSSLGGPRIPCTPDDYNRFKENNA